VSRSPSTRPGSTGAARGSGAGKPARNVVSIPGPFTDQPSRPGIARAFRPGPRPSSWAMAISRLLRSQDEDRKPPRVRSRGPVEGRGLRCIPNADQLRHPPGCLHRLSLLKATGNMESYLPFRVIAGAVAPYDWGARSVTGFPRSARPHRPLRGTYPTDAVLSGPVRHGILDRERTFHRIAAIQVRANLKVPALWKGLGKQALVVAVK